MAGGRYPPGTVDVLDPPSPQLLYDGPFYPNHGYPPRRGEDRPALSAWGRLAQGGALGKKVNVAFDQATGGIQSSPVTVLNVQGDDADAQQVVVTLARPRVVPQAFAPDLLVDVQGLSGSQDNQEIQSRPTFPGTGTPILWPPFVGIVQWGTGGTFDAVEVDMLNGASVSVVASFIRVLAAVDVRGGVTGTSAVYTLAAFVGPGLTTRPGAQRTVYVGVVAAATESAVTAVPPFARYATVVADDPAAAPATTAATLRFWQSPDGVASGNSAGNFVVSGAQPVPFPVPSGAAYASVRSGMASPVRLAIVYTLSV